MIVYHGSNCDIDEINLTIGGRYKDFGQGFYVTPDIDTAQRMAIKKVELFQGAPTIITYELDELAFNTDCLNALIFPEKATTDWIRFVDANRDYRKQHPIHNFDIVKGPIADDGVALQLGRLKLNPEAAEDIAIALQDKFLDQQIYFGTPEALKFLKKLNVCILK